MTWRFLKVSPGSADDWFRTMLEMTDREPGPGARNQQQEPGTRTRAWAETGGWNEQSEQVFVLLKVWWNIWFRVCRLQILNNPHLKKIYLHVAAPPQQIWPPPTHRQTRITTVIIIIIQRVLLIQAEGGICPAVAIFITFRPVTLVLITLVEFENPWVLSQSGLCGAFRVRSSVIVASVGVVLLAADLIVATIQVSRDYVSAAALRADNLSLQQLIWQHVNESCLKLKANINSHLAKGSECPQSQCIKWFDW